MTLPWTMPGWMDEVRDWVADRLAADGLEISGPIEQPHIRPWSIVLRIPTPRGLVFFKASSPVLAHEPGLAQTLSSWRPDCMQSVLAVDLPRAWMLMPDESPWLRALIQTKADLVHWERILPIYAGLQRQMVARVLDLLAMGMFDRRLAGLPAQFESLLADRQALLIDQADSLTTEQHRRLTRLLPIYAEDCAHLAAYGLPETLHHDDFHDGNVFVPGQPGLNAAERGGPSQPGLNAAERGGPGQPGLNAAERGGGRYAFSDWGESCVTHPFFTMLVTLRSIAYRLNLPYGSGEDDFVLAPEILHLRDVYLSAWTDLAPLEELRAACDLAWRVAMVNRALTWHRVVSSLPEKERAEHANAVPGWLLEYLDIENHVRPEAS